MGHIIQLDEGMHDENGRIQVPSFPIETQAKPLAREIFRIYGVEEDLLPSRKIVMGNRIQFFRVLKGGKEPQE